MSADSSISIAQLARREKMVSTLASSYPVKLQPVPRSNDRSAPKIQAINLKKQYDRKGLMESLRGAVPLRVLTRAQIKDRSSPVVDANVHIQFVERSHFLDNVLSGAHTFYERLVSSVPAIQATASDVASFAQAKAGSLIQKSISTASGVSSAAFETAQNAQQKAGSMASDIIEAGMDTAHSAQVRAAELLEKGKETAAAVRYTWNDLYATGKDTLAFSPESRKTSHQQLLADIKANRLSLSHVNKSDIKDRSKPFVPSAGVQSRLTRVTDNRTRVMSEIKHSATVRRSLNHVSTRDASQPALPTQLGNIHKNDRKELLKEVQSAKLNHIEEVCDRSAPQLPQGKVDLVLPGAARKDLLIDVKKGVDLHQNVLVNDRSAPQLPSM